MAEALFLSAAANAVGTLMVDYLVKPVERRLHYLFRFKKIVEELQEQEKKLSTEHSRVLEDVKEAKLQTQTQVIMKYVEDWMKEAENVQFDARCLESIADENKRWFCWCPHWCWRYKLSKKMEKKTVAIRKLVEDSKFERFGHRATLPGIEFMASKGYFPSKSSASAFNKIMEALKGNEVNMIGVWGMGGVGKTTLVKVVGGKVKEEQLFDRVIKVVVSRPPINIEQIQNKIADFIDLKFEKKTPEGKAEELWLRLEKEKFLIILDDLWSKLDLEKIGIPFDKNCKGCKIILTTRRKQVCECMESQVVVSLGIFDEVEAWKLFKTKACLDEDKDDAEAKVAIKLAQEVAKECKGLPVAIVTLASALKGTETVKEWEVALKKLQSCRLMEIENIEEEVEHNAYMCLKTSYDYLQRNTTKRCFLLCSLFPEDYSIDVEELVRYVWGLQLYRNTSIDDVRFEVMQAINHLKDSCLLLEGDGERHIKLHDVVHDVAFWIASEEDNGLVIESGSKGKLEILLLDHFDSETPIDYFEGMQELKVLRLKASKSDDSAFSLNALKSLPNLRTLQLEGFEQIEGISALESLKKLEILCLHGSRFQESIDAVGGLKNLRVLDMYQCKFLLGFPLNLIRRLVELEELYLYDSMGGKTNRSAAILPELNFLPRLASLSLEVPSLDFRQYFLFPKLQRFQIAINRGLQPYPSISSRSLKIEVGELSLNMISELLWNIEFLQVFNFRGKAIEHLTDTTEGNVPMVTILQNLVDVNIQDCENLHVIFEMKKAKNHSLLLSELKRLCLKELPNLECIWKMPTQHVNLQSLEAVNFYGCGKLKFIFPFSLAQSLVRLEELAIYHCHELGQIFIEPKADEEISSDINSDSSSQFLPKLRILRIHDCDKLEYIFPNIMVAKGVRHLQVLNLKNCPELTAAPVRSKNAYLEEIQLSKLNEIPFINTKYLVLSKIKDHNLIPEVDREGLNELTVLRLSNSDSLEYLVDSTQENVPSTAFSNLVELCLQRMGGLRLLCNGQLPKGFLQNLKELKVEKCDKLHEVFIIDELFYTREENQAQLLSNLEHLELQSLPELRWILKGSPHYFRLKSLKVVKIIRCEKLKSLFSPSLIQSLLLLEKLSIEYCYDLKTLFAELENGGEKETNSHLQPMCLPRLAELKISNCFRLEYVFPPTLGLPKLEKLEIENCSVLKETFAELESNGETESNGHLYTTWLQNLTTLSITGCPSLEYVIPVTLTEGLPQLKSAYVDDCLQLKQVFGVAKELDGVEHCINLPSLIRLVLLFSVNLISLGPENYFVKAPNLKELQVSECPQLMKFINQKEVNNHSEKNPIRDVDMEGLSTLQLGKCDDLECLVDTTEEHMPTSGLFTNLVNLQLRNMIGLKMLCKGQPPEGFLPNLEFLMMERCMNIVSLYPVPPNLQKVIIRSCRNLQEVFEIDELLYSREENHAMLLSNLEILHLRSIAELRCIIKGPTKYVSLRNLKVVRIEDCGKLKYLFPFNLIQSLRLLEELRIIRCYQLETVFLDDETESNKLHASAQDLPRLKELKLHFLRCLHSFGRNSCSIKVPALKHLDVIDCPLLINFSIQQDKPLQSKLQGGYNIMSSSLETIKLGDLIWQDIWKGSIQVVVINNLRKLEVCKCNSLTFIFSVTLARNLPQLSTLKISWCKKVRIIVNDDISTSSAQGHEEDEHGVKNEKEMLILFPQLQYLWLERLPSLTSLAGVGYHLLFPSLKELGLRSCSNMITSFTMDSISLVHAKTKAPRPDDACISTAPDIFWLRESSSQLPPYVEEDDEF